MAGMKEPTREEHTALLAEMLIKHLMSMGPYSYESEPEHYGWAWKVTATRVRRSEKTNPEASD
jgi:hypothetical protein